METNRRNLLQKHRLLPLLLMFPVAFVAAATIPSKNIECTGGFSDKRKVSVRDLKDLPSKDIQFSAPDGSIRHYKGTLLRELIQLCGPQEPDHFSLRQSIVAVRGADGYYALFTWAELFINPVGDGVFVVYAKDGTALDASEGEVAVVSLTDSRPGPRYVKWAAEINLRRVQPN